MADLLEAELGRFQDDSLKAKIARLLRPPVEELRAWYYANAPVEYPCWRFADLGERGVWAAYCEEGFGALEAPWGLVFVHDLSIGMDSEWYPTLEALVEEWFAA